MPRQQRIEYAGAIYHVMNRGDREEDIFFDDEDRTRFLRTLGEACIKADWQVHAYCLMNNHFHLVLETPKPTLAIGMKWLLAVYTQRVNARHQKCGHLFAGRYKSLIIDDSDYCYLRRVCDYVHLNPVRAHLLKNGAALENFPWSSFGEYLKPSYQRVHWLRTDRLLREYGITKEDAMMRKKFATLMNDRCTAEGLGEETMYQSIRRGWRFGSKEFLERIFEKKKVVSKKEHHLSVERCKTMEMKGRRLIQKKLKELKLKQADLNSLRYTDPAKIEIAQCLRSQTTLSLKWISHELKAGAPGTLALALRKYKKEKIS